MLRSEGKLILIYFPDFTTIYTFTLEDLWPKYMRIYYYVQNQICFYNGFKKNRIGLCLGFMNIYKLKGQMHEIFDPRFVFINQLNLGS
jgi:hypothetical protein